MAYFEDENLALAITINGATQNTNDILIGILSIVFNEPFDLPKADEKPVKLTHEALLKFAGTFSSQSPQLSLKIVFKVANTTLQAQATGQGPLSLTAFSDTEFRFEKAGIVIKFDEENGKIDHSNFTLYQSGAQFKFKRD